MWPFRASLGQAASQCFLCSCPLIKSLRQHQSHFTDVETEAQGGGPHLTMVKATKLGVEPTAGRPKAKLLRSPYDSQHHHVV
jgi:hypothetical protein